VESAITGLFQVCPPSSDRATNNTALLSFRIAHHVARVAVPARVQRTDAAHASADGEKAPTEMVDGIGGAE
jgi:hypothetical protein